MKGTQVLWVLAVALGVFLLALFPITNDDAGFHVANGQWILEHGSVPTHNPFSYAQDGAVWTQHQWLSATLMASVVEMGGARLLVGAKACLFGLLFGLLAWNARSRIGEGWVPALFALAIGASCYRFVERPFAITLLFMALTTFALDRWRKEENRWLPSQLDWPPSSLSIFMPEACTAS